MGKTRNIVLSFSNNTTVINFLVNPKKLIATRPHIVKKYMTIDGYELSVNAGAGLRRVVFETYLPNTPKYKSEGDTYRNGLDTIWLLHDLQNSRLPVRLNISDTDVQEAFIIEDMSQSFYEGDKDIWIKLTLCEYRFPRTQSVVSDVGQRRSGDGAESTQKTSYIIKPGDTLWAISKRYLGDPLKWRELKQKNGIADEKKLRVGTVIYL